MKSKIIGNKNKVKIVIDQKYKSLLGIEECIPKPLSNYLPKWWKNVPLEYKNITTVKKCPSFVDVFSKGYVIPMWTDLTIKKINSSTFEWNTSTEIFQMNFHKNSQFIDFVPELFNKVILKTHCPWKIITPNKVSCWQMSMPFYYDREWEIMNGIINTSWYHEINQQILYNSDKNIIKIERGEPLAVYVPFLDEKFNFEVNVADNSDLEKIDLAGMRISTKFEGSGEYLKYYKFLRNNPR